MYVTQVWRAVLIAAMSCCCLGAAPRTATLKRSDVVFMYQAPREVYQAYGATVLAWGGSPTRTALDAATNMLFFGSVGMVTEFARYYDFDPITYEEGLCRDRNGQPYKVPWLTDHQHKGIPFWWCCTSQPRFRNYLSNRVTQVVLAGANGVHIDDHLGTAGSLWLGACFCERCLDGFRVYLGTLPEYTRTEAGTKIDVKDFNFRTHLKAWLSEKEGRKQDQHPLWGEWRLYHLRNAASYMSELRALAARVRGQPVPMSANAGLLWPSHLADYKALDFLSAEIDHHATENRMNDHPVLAYRLADAVGRPLASTASGQDWAHIKEQNRPGLVRGWIALGYASGHSLMAPNRQWCYTSEKGTHWYEGPKEVFAPLYQFASTNAHLLDRYENHADLIIALPHGLYDRDSGAVRDLARSLGNRNIAFSIALGSDGYVDHPLKAEDLSGTAPVIVMSEGAFTQADRQVLATVTTERKHTSLQSALSKCVPSVEVDSPTPVRIFPRKVVGSGETVVHILNWSYDAAKDNFQTATNVVLRMRPEQLGVKKLNRATLHRPGAVPTRIQVEATADGPVRVRIPDVTLWAIVELNWN